MGMLVSSKDIIKHIKSELVSFLIEINVVVTHNFEVIIFLPRSCKVLYL